MHHQCVLPLHMEKQATAKEAVLEFRDNPPRGFQRAVNLVFYWFVSGSSLTKNKH